MFYPFTREEIKPRFVLDGSDDYEQDAIETTLLGVPSLSGLPDFWRITADGRATIIRPYVKTARHCHILIRMDWVQECGFHQ